jgi:hypothetical protein
VIVEIDGARFEVPDDATPEEIDALSAPAPEPVGKAEAAARALSSVGTGGFGTKMFGLRPASRMSGFSEHGALGADEDRRRKLMQEQQERDSEALRQRPGVSLLAGAPAAALAMPFAAASRAPSLLGRLVQASKAGAAFGAAGGAGRAQELEDLPGNITGDALTGAVAGPLLQGGGEALGAGWNAIRNSVAPRLQSVAVNQGRKLLTGNAAPMATKKPLSEDAIRAAYEARAIRPFTTVEKAAERLGTAREAAGQQYADIVAALEAKGVTGPNASKLASELLQEAEKARSTTFTSVDPGPGAMGDIAFELLGLQQGMHGVKRVQPKALTGAAPGGDLPLTVAEGLKRKLQQSAQAEYVKEGRQSLGGESKTEIARFLRQAIEDSVTEQAGKAPAEAAAFEPVKRQVGSLIEASTAANRASARAANRQTFGLGSKVLAGGALASGNLPAAAATMVGATALRNRGPATVGSIANALANALGKAPPNMTPKAAGAVSEGLSEEVRALIEALIGPRGGPRVVLPAGAAEEDPR